MIYALNTVEILLKRVVDNMMHVKKRFVSTGRGEEELNLYELFPHFINRKFGRQGKLKETLTGLD